MSNVVVFDFDGVLSRLSESFKKDAWGELFPPHSEMHADFRAAESEFGGGRGGSRYDILRSVYAKKGLTGEELENKVLREEERFDGIVQRKITQEGIRPEDKLLLEQLKNNGFRLYINSATPKERLEKTIENLGLAHIFGRKQILGQPSLKDENLKLIADKERLGPSDKMLFIGDSTNDFLAVEKFNGLRYKEIVCGFFGFENKINKGELHSEKFSVIHDLSEIMSFFSERAGEKLGDMLEFRKEHAANDNDEWGLGKMVA